MKISSLKFLALAFFALTLLAVCPAQAQQFLDAYKKPMPDIKLLPQAEFESKTTVYSDEPLGDKALAYHVRMPNDWQKAKDVGLSNDAIGSKILGELVKFYGPPRGDARSYFSIQAVNLAYKLTAEEWLIQYLLANSYTMEGMKTYDKRRAEVLYIYGSKDETYVVRTVIQINGNRVILAQYFLPTQYWADEKQTQAQVTESFSLDNTVEVAAEAVKKYHFLDIAEFNYPESWEIHADPLKSIDRIKVQLFSIESEEVIKRKKYKTLNGRMSVDLVSYSIVDNIDDEIKKYKDDLQKTGLIIRKKIEEHNDFKIDKSMDAKPVQVFNAVDDKNNILNYELWLEVLESGDYYYFVSLLTPSRDEDYFTWSRNVETFRALLETIKSEGATLTDQ